MALALDSSQGADKAAGATNWSYNHTLAAASPEAVLVLVGHQWNGDTLSAVSFGGIALTRLWARAHSSAGDGSYCYAYFRAGGFETLASGVQSVSFTESDNTAGVAGSYAFTSGRGVEVVAMPTSDLGTVSNPSLTVTPPFGRPCFIGAFLASGSNTIAATSAAGQTRTKDRDYGSQSGYVDRKTNIEAYTASTTMAWTIGAFSATVGAVVLAETLGMGPGVYGPAGMFAKAEELWSKRGRIVVPKLWTPREVIV